jgi:hypothetical protein
MVQALQFTSDFKLGHYMKIPPRSMFFCQVVATVIAGTVQLGVQAWMFTNIRKCRWIITQGIVLAHVADESFSGYVHRSPEGWLQLPEHEGVLHR